VFEGKIDHASRSNKEQEPKVRQTQLQHASNYYKTIIRVPTYSSELLFSLVRKNLSKIKNPKARL
jgi:hypothetical protein